MTEQPGSRTVLIAGASGVIGAAAVEHFASLPGWRVIGVSRRPPDPSPARLRAHRARPHRRRRLPRGGRAVRRRHPRGLRRPVREAGPGARLVRAGPDADQPGDDAQPDGPAAGSGATGLRHVSVLQGTKAYGAHVHR